MARAPWRLESFCSVGSVNQGNMAVDRFWPAHSLDDLKLPRRIVEMIVAADDVGHSHVEIIDHDRKHIGRRAVGAQQHHIVELRVGVAHQALHDVFDNGFAGLRRLDANDERRNLRGVAWVTVPPASVIALRPSGRALLCPHRRQLFGCGIAAIGAALAQKCLGDLAVALQA